MPILSMGYGWGIASRFIDRKCGQEYRPKWCLLLPFFYTGKLVLAYSSSVFFVYLYVPGLDIIYGFRNLFCHASFKGSYQASDYAHMPAKRLFEQIGEAVPQFCIATTFYALNWHWLCSKGKAWGVVKMTLSAGSMVMGLVKGILILCSGDGYLKKLLTQGQIYTKGEQHMLELIQALKEDRASWKRYGLRKNKVRT